MYTSSSIILSCIYKFYECRLTIKIASEVGAQMKLRFLTLMLPMLNFGSNSVERSRSTVAMGIQSSDFVHQKIGVNPSG